MANCPSWRRIVAIAAEPCRTMFAIAGMTGLRACEVMGLQKGDLDFEQRVIHVRRSAWHGRVQTVKSKASRAPVVMSETLAAMLREYLATWQANPEGFLFLNRKGRPYSQNHIVQKRLWPIPDALSIPRCGLHAFRHCHASLLIDVGANPKVAQEQIRHSDARITLGIYGHVIGDAQREAVDKNFRFARHTTGMRWSSNGVLSRAPFMREGNHGVALTLA